MSRAPSPLLPLLEAAGGVHADYHGRTLVRHFGEPSAEYRAASEGVAVFDRSHRIRLVIRGRAPGQMLNGVLTGTMPSAPAAAPDPHDVSRPGGPAEPDEAAGGVHTAETDEAAGRAHVSEPAAAGPRQAQERQVLGGMATYHAVLTPKGKMITDLWALRLGDEQADGFLLDVPVAGAEPLLAHFGRVLPPRFAAVEDVSERTAMITLAGPLSARLLSRLALGLRVEASELDALEEGAWRAVPGSGGGAAVSRDEPAGPPTAGSTALAVTDALVVIRTEDVWTPAYTVVGPSEAAAALWKAVVEAGARPAGLGVWNTLRVEAGRPAFGTDMDERTIPVEAGIDTRAIDHRKGCYTGQEVIVRIRDRGKVNRHLRRLELGEVPTPAPGTELFPAGAEDVGAEGAEARAGEAGAGGDAAEADGEVAEAGAADAEAGAADAEARAGEAGAGAAPPSRPAKPVGWITSAVESPRFGGVVALAYVRREAERVRLGGHTIEVGPTA